MIGFYKKIILILYLINLFFNCSAQRLMQPRTAARFYSMLQPVDTNTEPRLAVALIYNLPKSQRNSELAEKIKCAHNSLKQAASSNDYVHFIEVNTSQKKAESLNCDFELSTQCPNLFFFKNGELVSKLDNGCNWEFTSGEILSHSRDLWSDEINNIREERTERYNTLQELAAESIYYDLAWSWGGPFYRGYNGWNGFYGYNPYDIWPFSGSMIGN